MSDTKTKTTSTTSTTKKKTPALTAVETFAVHFNTIPREHCVCFTDGSCLKNPGAAGVGMLMLGPYNSQLKRRPELARLSRSLGHGTNNIAELYAIYTCLQEYQPDDSRYTYVDPNSFLNSRRHCNLTIVTDSKYAINLLSQNWKAKANQQLVQRIKDRMADLVTAYQIEIYFLWSPGHSGIEYNEIVDTLAKNGARQTIGPIESAFFKSLQ